MKFKALLILLVALSSSAFAECKNKEFLDDGQWRDCYEQNFERMWVPEGWIVYSHSNYGHIIFVSDKLHKWDCASRKA